MIQVLDHGYIKLIGKMGTDETIIEAARMSTGKGFISWEPYEGAKRGDLGLLEYLYKNQHMTPFEMCEMAIEVQLPIFVAREWMRHRVQSFNEYSGRYAEMPDLYYVPQVDRIQKQSQTNKQASGEPFTASDKDQIRSQFFVGGARKARSTYEELLKIGVARELARINLPLSQYTRFRAKANLRNWLGFLLLRMAPNAQYEIRDYAYGVARLVQEGWPRTWALFEEYDLKAKKLSQTEIDLLLEVMGYGLLKTKGDDAPSLTKEQIDKAWALMRRLA